MKTLDTQWAVAWLTDLLANAREENVRLTDELRIALSKRSTECERAAVIASLASTPPIDPLAYSLHSDRQDVFGGRVTTEPQ